MSCFEGTLLRVLKIEETGGGKHPKRQTRDVPAIYLCRRGPPARNLRHFLFFSPLSSFSSTFLSLFLSPAPFILSLSAPLRIFFFLFVLVFLLHLSSPFFSLSLPSHAVSRSLSLSLSVGSSPFADLRVDQTLQMDTLFLSGATCRTWFPPFLQERSRVSVSCVSQRHPRSKETR